jgi:hypothetical protein
MPFQFRKEAIEEDLNSNFPSQGQGNPPLYYSLSEVVVPTYSINSVAEGSILREDLQRAWDFSTGHDQISNTTTTIVNNTGFWLIDLEFTTTHSASVDRIGEVYLTNGLTNKTIWKTKAKASTTATGVSVSSNEFVVFVKSGESIVGLTDDVQAVLNISYRQLATVNGTLVNPLGFSAA